jgi:FkbM family methyltransferase
VSRLSVLLDRVRWRSEDARTLGVPFSARELLARRATEGRYRCDVKGFGELLLRVDSTDPYIVQQVFRDRHYDLRGVPQGLLLHEAYATCVEASRRPVIIDCGANNGASALWFSLQFPHAMVLAVEPDPGNAGMCRQNTAHRPNVVVHQAGISSTAGRGEIDREAETEDWAIQTRLDPEGSVPMITISQLLDEAGGGPLLLVKIDIEGFESDLFERNTEWLEECLGVLIEPHDWHEPERRSSRSFQRAFGRLNFDLVIRGENLFYFNRSPKSW